MTTPPSPGEQTHRPRSKRRLGCQTALLVALGVTLLIAGMVTWNWNTVPAYWKENFDFLQKTPPAELSAMARRAEQRVLRETTRLGRKPGETYTIEITLPEANAWLALQLPQWLANQGESLPEQFADPMIAVTAGRPVLAFQYDSPELKQVVSVFFNLESQPDGKIKFTATEVMGGNQSIPALGIITKQLKENSPAGESSEQLNRVISAVEGQVFDVVIPVDEVRSARVLKFDFLEDKMIFTLKNEER